MTVKFPPWHASPSDTELEEFPSMLAALKGLRIVKFGKDGDGFYAEERCDRYFGVRLTREHVLMLADELRALASERP